MTSRKKLTFEQQLDQVEALIARMEAGGMSLEDSVKQYEDGLKMLSALEKELQGITQRLTVLRTQTASSGEKEERELPLEVEQNDL